MTSDSNSEDPRREYSDHAFIETVRQHQPPGPPKSHGMLESLGKVRLDG